MAYFNEENTVEQMLINAAGKCGWIYVEPKEVPRLPDEVLVTEWLLTALKKFNDITDDQAAQDNPPASGGRNGRRQLLFSRPLRL